MLLQVYNKYNNKYYFPYNTQYKALGPSGWYWCLGLIQGVIWKKVCIILFIPGINIRYIHLCSSSEVLNVIKCVFIESVRQGCCRTLDEMIGKDNLSGKYMTSMWVQYQAEKYTRRVKQTYQRVFQCSSMFWCPRTSLTHQKGRHHKSFPYISKCKYKSPSTKMRSRLERIRKGESKKQRSKSRLLNCYSWVSLWCFAGKYTDTGTCVINWQYTSSLVVRETLHIFISVIFDSINIYC